MKYISRGLVLGLINVPGTPLKKSYQNTWYCSDVIEGKDGKLISSYCKNRWCLICNRIKIANLINRYKPKLKEFNDPYFVTLTCRTVKAEELRQRIKDMRKEWFLIYKLQFQKKGIELRGVRKMECTARPNDLYHPHFHFIINGKKNAEWLRSEWLERWPQESEREGQDIRKADQDSMLEIFKYFTKLITKVKSKDLFNPKSRIEFMHPEKLDVIFRHMKSVRVFAAFGIKKVDEDDTKEEAVISGEHDGKMFKWVDSDWFHINNITEKVEALTGWVPNKRDKELKESGHLNIKINKPKPKLGRPPKNSPQKVAEKA